MIRRRKKFTSGVPCPECGEHSRVTRTTIGERRHHTRRQRSYVLRERVCAAGHEFKTEEHPRND
jgi:hypothetical protein